MPAATGTSSEVGSKDVDVTAAAVVAAAATSVTAAGTAAVVVRATWAAVPLAPALAISEAGCTMAATASAAGLTMASGTCGTGTSTAAGTSWGAGALAAAVSASSSAILAFRIISSCCLIKTSEASPAAGGSSARFIMGLIATSLDAGIITPTWKPRAAACGSAII